MSAAFSFSIVTPDGAAVSGTTELLVVPTPRGELGILANHAPLVSGVAAGTVRSTREGKTESFGVSGGVVEVRDNAATQLVLRAGLPKGR